jgi:hypothetical protein
MPKKVDAMMHLEEPKTRQQLCGFIGMVNYYRDMWKHHSHVLAPLTSLTSINIPWKWGKEQSKAFKEAKKILSTNVLLAFPVFDKPFIIHTGASHRQLRAVICKIIAPSHSTVKNSTAHRRATLLQSKNCYL